MNDFMKLKEKARKANAKSFTYNGVKYVRGVSSNGKLIVYRRADGKKPVKKSKKCTYGVRKSDGKCKRKPGPKSTSKPKKSKSKKSGSKRKLNPFMQAKEKARKSGASSFVYNGNKYKKSISSNGKLVVYKRV